MRHRYGPHFHQFGDLLVPDGPGPFPVAVVLHGGFWRERFSLDLMDDHARDLPRRGFAAWNVEYRRVGEVSGGGYPVTLEDVAAAVDALAGHHLGHVDLVAGMEARGFIIAAPVAIAARAGFVPVRKKGKLPGPVHEVTYALEYGEGVLAVHRDGIPPGARVLIVDDVLATGGTAAAALDLVEQAGGTVAGFTVLLELGFLSGRERLAPREVHALLTV